MTSITTSAFTTRRARAEATRLRRHRGLMRGVAFALPVLVLVPVLWVWWVSGPRPMESIARYPGTPPAEWGPAASWVTPPLLPGLPARPVGDAVALVTADRHMLLVGADGTPRWQSDVPDGDVRSGITPTRIEGQDVLALHLGDTVTWWTVDDGRRHRLDLPAGAKVSMLGEVPLVTMDDANVMALTDPKAPTVTLAPGSLALAAHEDGRITVTTSSGWSHVGASGEITSSGPWETSSRMPATVVGYAAGHILLLRPGNPTRVEVQADRTDDVRFVFDEPIVALPGSTVTWSLSPSGTWGILGRSLIDLGGGRVQDLGAWSTSAVLADRAYGHIDGRTVVVGPAIPRGILAPAEAVPEAVLDSGALVRGPVDTPGPASGAGSSPPAGIDPRRSEPVLYFLPPRKASS